MLEIEKNMVQVNLAGKRYFSATRFAWKNKDVTDKLLVGEESTFKLLNRSSTLAQISLVNNDIPIMVRKNCLMAIHADSEDTKNLTISREQIYPWANIVNFQSIKSSLFNRISLPKNKIAPKDEFDIAKRPVQLIVSPNKPTNSLYHLNLTGSYDWNIWGARSIVAFEDNTSLELIPSNKVLFDKLSKLSKFNILKGRGNVLLNGVGSIVKIDLTQPYEKIMVNYNNLLAISGESQIDINNSINNRLLNTSDKFKTYNWIQLPIFKWGNIIRYLTTSYKNFYNGIIYYYNNWKFGYPNSFMEIKGPRSILLQTFDTLGDNSIINYKIENMLASDILQKSYNNNNNNYPTNENENNKKNLIKYWNVRIYQNDERVQFTPTNNQFKIKK